MNLYIASWNIKTMENFNNWNPLLNLNFGKTNIIHQNFYNILIQNGL